MSRLFARRRLLAVGLSLAIAIPILGSTSATASDRDFEVLRLRDSGPRVLLAQRVLDVDPRTGVYNRRTKHAVKRFQDHRGFAVTGLVNERTWHALERRWDAIQDARRRIDAKYHRIMRIAKNQKGDPYQYGAAGPNRFDCSGLVYFSTHRAGFGNVPRTSSAQSRFMRRISRSAMRPGDYVFFTGGSGVYHVGIFVGRNDGRRMILHAPGSGKRVRVDGIWTDRWFAGTLRGR